MIDALVNNFLDIEVSHALSVGLNESFAGRDFVTH